MNYDLFDELANTPAQLEEIEPGVVLLRGAANHLATDIHQQLDAILNISPFRHMFTPGGRRMAVATSSCGPYGWISDKNGYRYHSADPLTEQPWPAMPANWARLASESALHAGFPDFLPDSCLINRYQTDTQLSLHQDKNERDFKHPIVSVSLGLSAQFLLGGMRREDASRKIPLMHGDVLVWGNQSRLRFHGISRIQCGYHPLFGDCRINLTFRRAN
ncbi:DNA oxidative demethylase AlkB [Undibacterium curvum]|uniref:DNA oxidative demethylase AlkB n=1 Tax=Undibacterium curvum TaxID=2762294 RepID=A0ABR7A8U6_9BURK|nr:DNA oxidative demethylase AlkB [Undibacterium curvum]MBC3933320.1 DNA oxidative demethylase AlkB [Undibacterium curvum]